MGLWGRERKPQCLVFQPPSDFDPFYPAAFRQGSVLQSSNVRNPLPPQIPSQFLSSPNEKKKKKENLAGPPFTRGSCSAWMPSYLLLTYWSIHYCFFFISQLILFIICSYLQPWQLNLQTGSVDRWRNDPSPTPPSQARLPSSFLSSSTNSNETRLSACCISSCHSNLAIFLTSTFSL